MKIIVTQDNDEKNFGEYQSIEIEIDGERKFLFGKGEPEDMTLYRDLSDVYNIVPMLKKAWEAGKNGEPLEIEEREVKDE